jgi:hypothetical protein
MKDKANRDNRILYCKGSKDYLVETIIEEKKNDPFSEKYGR